MTELVLTLAVVAAFATIAITVLVTHYRTLKPPTTAYCPTAHPAFRSRIRPIGGAQFACHCPHCHDKAIIVAEDETTARREYANHPCDPQ